MIVRRLVFDGYRNLAKGEIYPCENVNVIYGKNAQGKTNLLEALWLFSGNRSFRGAKDSEFIGFGKEKADLITEFYSEERVQNAEIIFQKGKKEVKLNGIKQNSVNKLMGKLCIVVFSPEHLSMVKRGPAERRKFIDSAICQIRPNFSDTLSEYNKLLIQRNAILKDLNYHSDLSDIMDIWEERLAVYGASVIRMRINYTERLSDTAEKYHLGISEGKEKLDISYACGFSEDVCSDRESLVNDYIQKPRESRKNDIKDGATSIGPHRDDITLEINGENLRSFGSQGQQRSAVLSMKIAEAELIKQATEQEPIVLLDDVLSELDSRRQKFLLNKIDNRQVFISCCERASADRLEGGKLFYVENGEIMAV